MMSKSLAKEIIKNAIKELDFLVKHNQVSINISKLEKWQIINKLLLQTTDILEKYKKDIYTAAFDGSATPNPGKIKIGGWIRDPQGFLVCSYSKEMGEGTNNEAEYSSLLYLMKEIDKRGIKKVIIYGDSAVVINQVNGIYKTRKSNMQSLRDKVIAAGKKFEYTLEHIKRKYNTEADSLT